jgi:hypothetical protein
MVCCSSRPAGREPSMPTPAGALSSATRSAKPSGAGSGLTAAPALAGSRRPAGTVKANRDSWVGKEDEDTLGPARDAARRAAWDGAATPSPYREKGLRRRSVRIRWAKRPGGSVSPVPGWRSSWGGSSSACAGSSCSCGGEDVLSCGLGRATTARVERGNKEGCQDAIARLGKPLAARPGCRGVEKKSQGFFVARGGGRHRLRHEVRAVSWQR